MTQVVDKARAYKQAMTDARGAEIAQERSQTLPGAVGSTATAQAIRHPGRALDVMQQFWDSSDLPGPVKALLGVGQLGLAGINDLAHLDEESSRSIVGSMAYALSFIPGTTDPAYMQSIRDAFEHTEGGLYEKSRAANEAYAKGHEVEAGISNAVFSPSNLLTLGGGGLAKLGLKTGSPLLAKLATGALRTGEASDVIQGLPIKAITYPLGKAVQGGRYALGGEATKAKIAEQLASEMVAGKLVRARPGLLGQPRGVQAALPGVADVPGEVLASGPRGAVQQALPLGQAPPVNMAPGGRVPPYIGPRPAAAVQRGLPPGGDVLGLRPGLAVDYTQKIAGNTPLTSLVSRAEARELRTLFPKLGDQKLASVILQGRQNQPADEFAAFINKNWERARAGQLSAHDIINAYVPAVLSQRRGALSVDATLNNERTGAMPGWKIPESVRAGLTQGEGGDAGKYRPEDLAALMLHWTPEGRELGSALRYGDPQATQTAIDNFNAVWPHAGFMPGEGDIIPGKFRVDDRGRPLLDKKGQPVPERGPGDMRGGERGALVQAAHDDVFSSMAQMINRMASEGRSGDEIAQVMRDWSAGTGDTAVPMRDARPRFGPARPKVDRKTGVATFPEDMAPGGQDAVLPELASKNNWGAIIDRIANGKSGFLTTNLGGPSATFDVRVQEAMRPGATIQDYQRALDIMYPGDDHGLAHHKFWDAQDFTQTPHGGIAASVEDMQKGFIFPNPQNAGLVPRAFRGPLVGAARGALAGGATGAIGAAAAPDDQGRPRSLPEQLRDVGKAALVGGAVGAVAGLAGRQAPVAASPILREVLGDGAARFNAGLASTELARRMWGDTYTPQQYARSLAAKMINGTLDAAERATIPQDALHAAERVVEGALKSSARKELPDFAELAASLQRMNSDPRVRDLGIVDWYEQTWAKLEPVFGDDTELIMHTLAVTSLQNSVSGNVSHTLKAYAQWKSGGVDAIDGMKTLGVTREVKRLYRDWEATGGFKGQQGVGVNPAARKRTQFVNSFKEGFMRHLAVNDPQRAMQLILTDPQWREYMQAVSATPDMWEARGWGFSTRPTDTQFDLIRGQLQDAADILGLTPRQLQAAHWFDTILRWQGNKLVVDPAVDQATGTVTGWSESNMVKLLSKGAYETILIPQVTDTAGKVRPGWRQDVADKAAKDLQDAVNKAGRMRSYATEAVASVQGIPAPPTDRPSLDIALKVPFDSIPDRGPDGGTLLDALRRDDLPNAKGEPQAPALDFDVYAGKYTPAGKKAPSSSQVLRFYGEPGEAPEDLYERVGSQIKRYFTNSPSKTHLERFGKLQGTESVYFADTRPNYGRVLAQDEATGLPEAGEFTYFPFAVINDPAGTFDPDTAMIRNPVVRGPDGEFHTYKRWGTPEEGEKLLEGLKTQQDVPSEDVLGFAPGLARTIGPEVRDANLAKFMDGAHPLLKDEHGFPKVFYHGTSAGDFAQFADPAHPGVFGRGIYLTEDPGLAGMYADDTGAFPGGGMTGQDNPRPAGNAGPNVKPVFVNLKNPLVADERYLAMEPNARKALARQAGHDGVIVTKGVLHGSTIDPNGIEEMVVFDPAAIKSASGNVGTFDPADPSLLKVAPQAQPQYAVQQRGQNPLQWLRTPVANYGGLVNTRLSTMGGAGLLGAGIGGLQPADSNEQRLEHAQQGALAGIGLGGAGTSRKVFQAYQAAPVAKALGKNLLVEALAAQRAAMGRKSKGLGALRDLPAIWRIQATSTLRNLLQDEGTARLWLADAGVRIEMMNKNWESLIANYNAGIRDPYQSLPQDTTTFLDAVGRTGYLPQVGASFMEVNKGLIDDISAGDAAMLEGGLAMLNPLQGGVPIAGALLGGAKGYTRPFQQKLFDRINEFTRVASRHAAFQDTVEKELPGVADRFIKTHGLQQLAGRDGLFSPDEVDALVPGLGPLWQKNVDVVIDRAEKRAKDILGDYEKEAFKGEKMVGKVLPFTSYAFRAYPRTAKMMLHHPGTSLALMMLMAKGANAAEQQDLPGYLAGTVPMDTDTPVAGGVVRAMAGGQDATGYANPLALLSPVGGALIGGDDLPEDANLYQKTASGLGRLGFGFNPLIEAGAVAMNKDYRLPSAPSRTAAIEQALPGPQLPSLAQGPINFLRQQAGGSPLETTALDRRIGQVFYEATGMALNDPAVQANPQLAALAASTLDPASPIVQEARARELQSGVARTTVGMASPVSVSARTDVQRVQDRARGAAKDLPPAAYDPAEVRKLEQSSNFSDQLQAMLQARANRGTQATPPPEAGITSGVSRTARAYAALDAWRRQNVGLAQIAPSVYRQQEQQLRELLGIQ